MLTAAVLASAQVSERADGFFDQQVEPILRARCLGCHNEDLKDGGISFSDRASLLKGGSRGPAIVPGHPETSVLIQAVRQDGALKMPPGAKLSAHDVATLTDWIARGAAWGTKLRAQTTWFDPAALQQPDVMKALESVQAREPSLISEWIRLTETASPSGKEQERAKWIRSEMEKLHLTELRTDDIGNVSAVRKGTGGGRSVLFAAHMDTVFPEGTSLKVQREGDMLRAPGIGDDTGNLTATLEMFRALARAGVKTAGDLILLASVQEEAGLLGMRHWMEKSGYRPDLIVAVDLPADQVWYGALRINQFKFIYTSKGSHTLESRGEPSPARAVARAIEHVYGIPLPPVAQGFGPFKVPVINVGMMHGGTVINAIPREAWFTVDLRSLDSTTQDRLDSAVVAAARTAAETEGVGFSIERKMGIDYSRALPAGTRRAHPLVQTALDAVNQFRKAGTKPVEPLDTGATDANIGVSMGIPSVAVGAVQARGAHTLEETAEAATLVPGVKMLIALAVSASGMAR